MKIEKRAFITHLNSLDKDFRIFYYSDTDSAHLYAHEHNFFEMYILISGRIQYQTAGSSFFLQPKDILFLNLHQPHCPVLVEPSATYERIALHVSLETLQSLSSSAVNLCECFTKNQFTVYHYPHEIYHKILSLLEQLFDVADGTNYGDVLLGRAYLTELFIEINKYNCNSAIYSFNPKTTNLQMTAMVKQYVMDHLGEIITIEMLAAYFFMNKYSFMHTFKKGCGMSAYQFILKQRVEIVLEMVEKGMSLTTASQLCGFNDYSNFYRSFRRFYGQSPRRLLKDTPVSEK